MTRTQWDIVCCSHLWWNGVWQRPQHIMTRLAQQHRVLWIEEPRIEIGVPIEIFEVVEERRNLHVGRLIYRSDAATFQARLQETLARSGAQNVTPPEGIRQASLLFDSPVQPMLEWQVQEYVRRWRQNPLVLWLYTPMVVNFIEHLHPDLVVYDVMDELTAFHHAPSGITQREPLLFEQADLIFTGGPSLHQARCERHPNVHLFPSGVEQQHFAQALEPHLPLPSEVANLSHPIIGFFGVIDERMDLDLLAQVARARPDWNWVMIGPVLKIEERALPRLPNILYLGQQSYTDLPAYLKAFDVAMLPFARNAATRFISPTKTLEYMAAHKPIVSTPIRDVIDLYGSVVRIAEDAEQFVDAVQQALNEGAVTCKERIARERVLLQRSSWDTIVDTMQRYIQERMVQSVPQ